VRAPASSSVRCTWTPARSGQPGFRRGEAPVASTRPGPTRSKPSARAESTSQLAHSRSSGPAPAGGGNTNARPASLPRRRPRRPRHHPKHSRWSYP
jgi:hypothetical protein